MARRIIKKKAEDPGAIVLLAASSILLIIALYSIYSLNGGIEEKSKTLEKGIKDAETSEAESNVFKAKAMEISKRIGWEARPVTQPTGKDEKPVLELHPEKLQGLSNTEDVARFLSGWTTKLADVYQKTQYGLRDKREDDAKPKLNLQVLITDLEEIAKSNDEKTKALISARQTSEQETVKIIGTKEDLNSGELIKIIEEKDAEINKLRTDFSTLEKRVKDIVEQGERDILYLQEGLNQVNEEVVNVAKKQEETMAKLLKEKQEYNDRLDKLRKRLELEREGVEIDGQITFSDAPNGYVYIDLGKNDAITEKMDFDVFIIEKHGAPRNKGKIKIIKIYDKFSQASILEGSMDSHNPIGAGDYINSSVYSRKKAKIFVLCGKSTGRYSFSELKNKIEEFGGKASVEITPEITYVVAGENYDKDENYKKAVHLGAVVLREKELYALMGLPWY
ncbi:MAG: BRCT domain-containing protein [Candidatus Brocadiia bacterium]